MTTLGNVGVTRGAVSELRSKYAEMHAMRVADAEGAEDARRVRLRMQQLAEKRERRSLQPDG